MSQLQCRTSTEQDGLRLSVTAAHTATVVAVVLLAAAVFHVRLALLMVLFAGIVGVLLDTVAAPLRRHLGWKRTPALAVATVLVVLGFGAVLALIGARLATQLRQLWAELPRALETGADQLGIDADWLVREGGFVRSWFTSDALPNLAGMGFDALGLALTTLVVVSSGVFLAASPETYRGGVLRLVPQRYRDDAGLAIDTAVDALRTWLVAQATAMVIVGVLTALAASLLGLPAPLAIGLLAGLMEFVPMVGAFIAAVPALLLALSESVNLLLMTAVAFVVIQQLEGNFITPLVQEKAASVPPAVVLFAVVVGGMLLGPAGAFAATPLAVLIISLFRQTESGPASNTS